MKPDKRTSFKERINQDLLAPKEPDNDSYNIARNTVSSPTVLFIGKAHKRSFSYSYMLNVGMEGITGNIDINFTSGKVVIAGKNLNQLFMDLHRHRVLDVNIEAEDIDDINITIYGD